MPNAIRIMFAAVLYLACAITAAQSENIFATKVQPMPPAELLGLLRAGGNVIYFRHAATVTFAEKAIDLEDCATQRNLSDEGRADAQAIGEAFRQLKIPVGEVLASPYCRTMDTARLAFGRALKSADLFSRGKPQEPDEMVRAEWLRGRLGLAPAPGLNTVLISHGSPLDAVAKEFLHEGEAVVARPAGDGSFRLIARLRPGQWAELAGVR